MQKRCLKNGRTGKGKKSTDKINPASAGFNLVVKNINAFYSGGKVLQEA